MNLARRALAALLLCVTVAGCGGGDDDGVTNPPPPGTSHTEAESNDFTPQSLGTLSAAAVTVAGTSSSDADVDLYRVTLSAPRALTASLSWSGTQDLDLAISNANGIVVRHVDTTANPEACSLPGMPAGNYTLRVGSRSASAAGYVLTIQSF